MERLVIDQHRHVGHGGNRITLLLVGHQQRGLAVVHTQTHAVRAEQCEQRHRNRATLDHTEHRRVEGPRRLQHDGHALSGLHAALCQPMRETRRIRRELRIGDDLVTARRVGHDQRITSACRVAIHALVRNVERLAIAVEQLPQPVA
ncbi:hypothetical protein SDC9_82662 [bioreactor metagenome]|uniref:Uncharacterized protein n=1 Tax=bioreactor metagenome TaxID=1076179 RepID=A0A644Z617_9ZZZZ